ncbi:MAG: type III-B CRISPR module RAMP protein Cmr1 [Chloroflexales bacterium]|nr:type III-B CRISPR module RAMP protein Cmr1 [Chloroflexales bacterium]
MRTIQIELETVTPLFLSGADQEVTELRAPAFRGVLRYWLRALHGATESSPERVAKVAAAERDVFGDTTRRSSLTLRVRGQPKSKPPWDPSGAQHGLQYLLFSVRQRNLRPRSDDIRPSVSAGESFELTLQQHGKAPDDHALRQGLGALWLLCNLGGLGTRSRRGAGSLAVRNVTYTANDDAQAKQIQALLDQLPPLTTTATTPEELQSSLADGLRRLWGDRPPAPSDNSVPSFDLLHPDYCRILVLQKPQIRKDDSNIWNRWDEALESLGQAFKAYRAGLDDDRRQVGALLMGRDTRKPDTIQRAAFGLPIVFDYGGANKSALEGSDHDRRASPLHMRITRLADGTFVPVVTCFKAKLLPDGEKLKLPNINNRDIKHKINQPDLKELDRLLNRLLTGIAPLGQALEVEL